MIDCCVQGAMAMIGSQFKAIRLGKVSNETPNQSLTPFCMSWSFIGYYWESRMNGKPRRASFYISFSNSQWTAAQTSSRIHVWIKYDNKILDSQLNAVVDWYDVGLVVRIRHLIKQQVLKFYCILHIKNCMINSTNTHSRREIGALCRRSEKENSFWNLRFYVLERLLILTKVDSGHLDVYGEVHISHLTSTMSMARYTSFPDSSM